MSDTATPAAAPAATPEPAPPQPGAAPAGAEAQQPTPTPAEGTEGPRQPQSAAEAKQALRRGKQYPSTAAEAKQALAQPKPEQHHSQQQPRAEDGKFSTPAPSDATAPETPPAAADAAAAGDDSSAATAPDPNAAAAPAPDATAAPDAGTAEVPEGMVRIDIPEGHPMRHRGDHYLVPQGHEEYHRWAVNNTIRRNDVEAAAKNTREWQQYANRLKAELDATREFAGGIFQDPAVIQQIDDIRKTYGDEAAKRFEAGLWAEQQGKVQELTQQQQAEAAQAERAQIVQGFMQQAHAAAQKRYPEWSQQEVANALAAYGSWVEARGADELKLDEFLQHADPVYLQNPRARATAEQRRNQRLEQERQIAAKAEADRLKAEEQKRLEEAAAQRAQYPWMRVPANAVPAQVGVDEGAGGPRTVQEAKRSLTRRGRQRVA